MKKICMFSALFLFIDQVIKYLVETFLLLDKEIDIIPGFFSLSRVHNYGAAFSIMQGSNIIFIIVTLVSLIGIYIYIKSQNSISKLEIIAYTLLIGGIIGNFIDRIFRGYVVDYLSFNLKFFKTPVFNLADIGIVLSVIYFMVYIYKGEIKNAFKS